MGPMRPASTESGKGISSRAFRFCSSAKAIFSLPMNWRRFRLEFLARPACILRQVEITPICDIRRLRHLKFALR